MSRSVGIRELKSRASSIVQEVVTERREVVITRRGREVARIVPSGQTYTPAEIRAFWKDFERLSREVGKGWPADLSAGQALSEDRSRL